MAASCCAAAAALVMVVLQIAVDAAGYCHQQQQVPLLVGPPHVA